MTPEEAIEIQSEAAYAKAFTTGTDFTDALKLGIEALKRHQERRQRFPNLPHLLLPGETKEQQRGHKMNLSKAIEIKKGAQK